jgi:hypothetical protein
MAKYTPGPWHSYYSDDEHEWAVYAEDPEESWVDSPGWWIATMHDCPGDGNAKANAALVAAAPDLLALVEAVEWVPSVMGGLVGAWCGGQYPNHKDDCPRQRALARARGAGTESSASTSGAGTGAAEEGE